MEMVTPESEDDDDDALSEVDPGLSTSTLAREAAASTGLSNTSATKTTKKRGGGAQPDRDQAKRPASGVCLHCLHW